LTRSCFAFSAAAFKIADSAFTRSASALIFSLSGESELADDGAVGTSLANANDGVKIRPAAKAAVISIFDVRAMVGISSLLGLFYTTLTIVQFDLRDA
jgi:hypothetical protein